MKVAIIHNKDNHEVINKFGMQNREFYAEETIQKIAASFEKAGHYVGILDGNKHIIERLEQFMPRVVEGEQMGMIFNLAYGIQGESRYTHIPSMLEMLGLPYVGSSPSGHAIALDKALTKIIWKNYKLPTPNFWVFQSAHENMNDLSYPLIVKPKTESVSFGIKIVENKSELKDAVQNIINEYQQPALVEQFIPGREFCVGLLGNSPAECFPVLEIDLEGDPNAIQTVDNKKFMPKQKICPAQIDDELVRKMQQISLQAFEALNLRDFARVDIRVDKDNNIYLLEINSMASLGHSGSYITAAKAAGYNFNTLVNKMLDVASVRYFSNQINPANPEAGLDSKISKSVKIRSFLKTRHQNTENLLKKITDINTFARNIEGVNSCQEIICNELSPLGFKMEIFPHLEIGNTIYLSNNINGETDYLLLASVDNNQKLDQQEAFTKNEQYYEGTGVWENKGGIAVMVAALQALRFTRDLKRLKIGILLLSDSSLNGKYSKKLIHEKSRNSKNIIGLSGAGKNGALVVSRSGSAIYKLSLKLRKKDKSQNVALASQQFNNILTKIGRISNQDEDNIIAPYNINFKSNIFKITAFGTAGLSVRYNSEAILEEIEQKLKNIVMAASKYKELDVQLEGDMKRPPMLFSKQSRELYEKIKGIGKEIDLRISSEHRWSSNNICFAIDRIPQIDGFGPAGNFLTPGNERIFAHSIQEKALLLALFMSSNLQSP